MFQIMLRRKNEVLLSELPKTTLSLDTVKSKDEIFSWLPEDTKNTIIAATVAKNMESLGYTPSKELFDAMLKNKNVAAQVAEFVIPEIKALKGADVEYRPMYPNFPAQVMEADKATLYINAIFHYLTAGEWTPEYEKEARRPLNEGFKLIPLTIGTEENCKDIFSNILNSAIPFSQQDKEDIIKLADSFSINKAMPKFMVNRENMATLASFVAQKEGIKSIKMFDNQIKSVTDVLRIINLRHGNGDATLAEPFKPLGKISRPERKMYLSLINNCKNAAEDMKINKSTWIKVGQVLHPGEYKDRYPMAYDAFNHIREKDLLKNVHTYNAVTENAMRGDDISMLKHAMTEKPGVFARNLDRLVRKSNNPQEIVDMWKELSNKVAPNLLWQVYSHFDRKIKEFDEPNKLRIFTIMGEVSKTKVIEDTTKPIPVDVCKTVKSITENALKDIYKNKPAMGKVYIDPQVAKCKVPNNTRDVSKGSVPMAKGSRLSLGDNANTVRGFVWWTNAQNDISSTRLDIDLSATFLDENLKRIGDIAYYNPKADNVACHSGDIVNGGNFEGKGVAEFIDINMDAASEAGIAYVAFSVNAFTEQQFSTLEHVRFGFMERDKVQDGEIFEPSTVQQYIKLNAPSVNAIPCLFDINSKEMIWMDAVGQGYFRPQSCVNNAIENIRGTTMACYKALHLEKPDIADVIRINVEARGGEIVENKESADTVFALTEGIRPTDLDYFSGNLIPAEVAQEYISKEEPENSIDTDNVNVIANNEMETR